MIRETVCLPTVPLCWSVIKAKTIPLNFAQLNFYYDISGWVVLFSLDSLGDVRQFSMQSRAITSGQCSPTCAPPLSPTVETNRNGKIFISSHSSYYPFLSLSPSLWLQSAVLISFCSAWVGRLSALVLLVTEIKQEGWDYQSDCGQSGQAIVNVLSVLSRADFYFYIATMAWHYCNNKTTTIGLQCWSNLLVHAS